MRRETLTSSQGSSTPQAHPGKPGHVAFCQTFEGCGEIPSPCWQALWLSGTQGHLGKWQEEREVEGLSAQPRLWVRNHLQYILQTQRTNCCYLAGAPTVPGWQLAVGRVLKRIRQSQKRCDEHPRPSRPLQEAPAESFQHKPVCFGILI